MIKLRQNFFCTLKIALLFAVPAFFNTSAAQPVQALTIDQCYALAEANYPLSKQRELIRRSGEYNIENISKAAYPQFQIGGQATYQSDVTKLAIPTPAGLPIAEIPKDQYKLYGEISQQLTDFGVIKKQKELQQTNLAIQEENLEVELYKLKDRINQLFFGILMLDEQLVQNGLLKKDIQTGMDKVQAAITNGTDFRSSLDKLKAELLKAQQKDIELVASRKAYTDMLSVFINQPVDENTKLEKPAAPVLTDSISRPEIKIYDMQKNAYLAQRKLLGAKYIPKLGVFVQGGVGDPSPLNFISAKVSGYYIGGLRLNWNLNSFYTLRKEKLLNDNDQQSLLLQRNTFLFNTQLSLKQQNAEVEKLRQLLQADNDIVQLRESIKKTSAVQLENGVITANDYVKEVNAEDQARQGLIFHQVQLLMAQYNHKTTSGN